MKKLLVSLITILIIGGIFIFFKENNSFHLPTHLYINNSDISLLIADTQELREKGLGDRESLSENSAMLFVFEKPDIYGFWMKGMKFPLDIIWLDKNYSIVHIEKNLLPETYPEIFKPETNSLYVLETNSGFAEKNDLNVGDKMDLR